MDGGFRVYSLMETLLSAQTLVFRRPLSCLTCSAPRSTRSAVHAHPAPTVTCASGGIWREIPSLILCATTSGGERKQHPERKRFHVNRRRASPQASDHFSAALNRLLPGYAGLCWRSGRIAEIGRPSTPTVAGSRGDLRRSKACY